MKPLEQILADWREDAAVLRRAGHPVEAQLRERLADEVKDAAHDYLTWLTEDEAILHSGKGAPWLRIRFPAWQEAGHARKDGRRRFYRLIVLPRRADPLQAYRDGKSAA